MKISGVSPLSTKNCTSKYNNFSLVREAKINPQLLELPDGLKDIGDSDIEPEDIDTSDQIEDLSVEEKHGIRHIQDVTPDIMVKNSPGPNHYKNRKPPMLDNIENIEMASTSKGSQANNGHKSHRVIEIQTSKNLKDTVGDYIDSSGGTIDAIEFIDQNAEPVQEISNPSQLIKNYSSVKKLEIGIDKKPNYTQRDDSSGKKTKNKLRELTQLTNDN